MYKYNLKSNCVDEQPTIEKPFEYYAAGFSPITRAGYISRLKYYKEHIDSLRSILVSGKVEWKDGEDVTGKFLIEGKKFYNNAVDEMNDKYFMKDVAIAIPIKQTNMQELDEVEPYYSRLHGQPIKQGQPQEREYSSAKNPDWEWDYPEHKNQSQEQQPIEKDWEDIFEMFQSTTDFVNSYAEVDYDNLKRWLKENYCPPLSQQAEPVRDIERIFERIIEEKDEFFDHDRDKKGEYAWVTNPDKIFTVKQAMKELKASSQQAEQPESAEPRPHLIGWECTRCRTVHSPYTTTCGCQPPTITTTEIKVPQWLIDHNKNQ